MFLSSKVFEDKAEVVDAKLRSQRRWPDNWCTKLSSPGLNECNSQHFCFPQKQPQWNISRKPTCNICKNILHKYSYNCCQLVLLHQNQPVIIGPTDQTRWQPRSIKIGKLRTYLHFASLRQCLFVLKRLCLPSWRRPSSAEETFDFHFLCQKFGDRSIKDVAPDQTKMGEIKWGLCLPAGCVRKKRQGTLLPAFISFLNSCKPQYKHNRKFV